MNKTTVNKKKALFGVLTLTAMSCLIGAFSGNLGSYQVYSQEFIHPFGNTYIRKFVITEFDPETKRFGFDKSKAKLEYTNTDNNINIKFALLATSILLSGVLLTFGEDALLDIETDSDVVEITKEAKKELKLAQVKHKFAMADKAQQQLFLSELQALVELNTDIDMQEIQAEEALDDKFVNAAYFINDGYDLDTAIAMSWNIDRGTEQHEQLKAKFTEWSESRV